MSTINRIILDFDHFPFPISNDQSTSSASGDRGLERLFNTIKKEYEACHVNKPYLTVRTKMESSPFEVVAIVNGKEWKILEGNMTEYHARLVQEVTDKYFYNMSLDLDLSADAFDFIRRIPQEEWKALAQKINASPSPSQEQLEDLKKGNWNAPVFKEEDWPILALKAYFQGDIDRYRVSTLLLYDTYERSNYPGLVKTHQIIDEAGNIDLQLVGMIENAVLELAAMSDKSKWSDTMREAFLEAIRKLPPEETQFFSLENLDKYEGLNQGLYIGGRGNKTASTHALIPPKLWNILQETWSSEHPMKANPVLGFSSMDDFARKTKRDVLILCRYVTAPTEVHGSNIEKEPIFAYLHDITHVSGESSNPDRQAWLKIAAELEKKNLMKATNLVLDRSLGYSHPSSIRQMSLDSSWENETKSLSRIKKGMMTEIFKGLNEELKKVAEIDASELDETWKIIAAYCRENNWYYDELLQAISKIYPDIFRIQE